MELSFRYDIASNMVKLDECLMKARVPLKDTKSFVIEVLGDMISSNNSLYQVINRRAMDNYITLPDMVTSSLIIFFQELITEIANIAGPVRIVSIQFDRINYGNSLIVHTTRYYYLRVPEYADSILIRVGMDNNNINYSKLIVNCYNTNFVNDSLEQFSDPTKWYGVDTTAIKEVARSLLYLATSTFNNKANKTYAKYFGPVKANSPSCLWIEILP